MTDALLPQNTSKGPIAQSTLTAFLVSSNQSIDLPLNLPVGHNPRIPSPDFTVTAGFQRAEPTVALLYYGTTTHLEFPFPTTPSPNPLMGPLPTPRGLAAPFAWNIHNSRSPGAPSTLVPLVVVFQMYMRHFNVSTSITMQLPLLQKGGHRKREANPRPARQHDHKDEDENDDG